MALLVTTSKAPVTSDAPVTSSFLDMASVDIDLAKVQNCRMDPFEHMLYEQHSFKQLGWRENTLPFQVAFPAQKIQYQGPHKLSKTWFSLANDMVLVCENFFFMGLRAAFSRET